MRATCSRFGFVFVFVVGVAACGGDSEEIVRDAAVADAPMSVADAKIVDAPGPADVEGMTERAVGHVELGGPVMGAMVELLEPFEASTTTNASGNFGFDVPLGSRVVVKVSHTGVRPLIRSWIVNSNVRQRQFYLLARAEEEAAEGLGHTIDESKAILEVDFRNAGIGGYGVTMTSGGNPVTAGFGVALEDDGDPVTSLLTVAGGGGSTLILGNVPPGDVSFTPIVPSAATLACRPCDPQPIPLQAGVVTWYDFECGEATDCL